VALRFALAFSVAVIVTLLGAAALRAASRRGTTGVRRRGTLAVAGGALAGWLFVPALPGRIVVVLTAALALAVFGAAWVTRAPARGARLVVVTGAAIAAVAAGVRLEWSGIAALDVVGTVVVIVGVAGAFRWVDATDGLAPALASAAMTGIFALAAFGDQNTLATVAAATGGAAIGFLAYNTRPASVYLNRDGALFLGYLVGVLAIDVQPSIGPPGDLTVPFLLLAVPLLEIVVVPIGQLRRRQRLSAARRDHLVHRLGLLGLPRWLGITVLAAAELALAALAVFAGRGVLEPVLALAGGVAVVIALLIAVTARRVAVERAPGLTSRVRVAMLVFVALVLALALPAAWAALRANQSIDNARALVERALDAARDGEAERAEARFAAAAAAFEDARDQLENPLTTGSLALPVVGPNLRATRELARVGVDLARAGERTAAAADPEKLEIVDGTVPLAEVANVTPELEAGARELHRALRRLDEIDPDFLLTPVEDALVDVSDELTTASVEADNGVAAARLAPAIFGGEGERRYLLLVQNNAEQRATGGFFGQWGILTAQGGKLDLADQGVEGIGSLNRTGGDRVLTAPDDYTRRYGRFSPAAEFRNVNMSPDFEVVTQVAVDQYRQATGEEVDGVLAVDPAGLAALLRLTGPVRVAPWPELITARNVVDVLLRDSYIVIEDNDARDAFFADVAEAVVDEATSGALGGPARLARVLGRAARAGHLILGFVEPEEEALAQELDVAGLITDVPSDSLLVTTQNAAANKIDYYLQRGLRYDVTLDPADDAREVALRAQLEVSLENTAPNSGLPEYVIGPSDERFEAGENRAYVSIYTPLGVTASTIDGEPEFLEGTREVDRNAYSMFLSIPAMSTRTMTLDLAGDVPLEHGGWYTLQLPYQPAVTPDDVTVTISVPSDWRIAETDGLRRTGERTAEVELSLDATTDVRVRLAPGGDNLWDELAAGGGS
jgi:UDP-N-acetylmuramyl pentapeptide phosphotransferase/UDP-N-acetylglucosamine-1-phosphate transferase